MKNLTLPSVALGTWSWGTGFAGGDQVFGHNLTAEELKPVFDMAMDHGLNMWDTAVVYGMGASETLLSSFTREIKRNKVILSTKFTPQIADDSETPLANMLDESLERFGTDYVDMYWIHNPADVERWTSDLVPLVKSGKIRRVGVSNHNLQQIVRAEEILAKGGVHLSAVQNHYSLLYRASEQTGILDYCRKHEMDFWAYMVLEQGALGGKYDICHPLPAGSQRAATYNSLLPLIEKLMGTMRMVGNRYGITPAQVALAWAIAKKTTPIIRVTTVSQVEDIRRAMRVVLTDDEVRLLEETADRAKVDTRGAWERPMI